VNEPESSSLTDPPHVPDPSAADDLTAPRRFKLLVAYDGYDFHGWQKQEPKNAGEPLRTAQGVLESAVRRTVRQPVHVLGASRTDAGVSAEGQVAAFTTDLPMRIPIERLHLAINSNLPDDLAVLSAERVPLGFDPIGGAKSKAYRYTIHNSPVKPVFNRHSLNHCFYELDATRMNQAAQHLVGEHDFESFANTHHGRESTIRTVFACAVSRDKQSPEQIHIDITGSGFLYHMVRIIAGTLVEVGRKHGKPDDIPRILNACDRKQAGPTLPPEGLRLKWIKYD